MAALEIPDSHADLFDRQLTAVLTTVGSSGQPQSTAVWFVLDEGLAKVGMGANRQKYRNLQRDPRATLFIFDPANPFRTLEIRATIELVADPDKAVGEDRFPARHDDRFAQRA